MCNCSSFIGEKDSYLGQKADAFLGQDNFMGQKSNFVGDTPYLNKMLNTYDGVNKRNGIYNGAIGLPTYQQSAGVSVSTGFSEPVPTTSTTVEEKPKRDWFGTLMPYLDKVAGITRAPEEASSVSTDIDPAYEDSSRKTLYWVIGIVVALVAVLLIWRAVKKK